jgi:hypothetical protein
VKNNSAFEWFKVRYPLSRVYDNVVSRLGVRRSSALILVCMYGPMLSKTQNDKMPSLYLQTNAVVLAWPYDDEHSLLYKGNIR